MTQTPQETLNPRMPTFVVAAVFALLFTLVIMRERPSREPNLLDKMDVAFELGRDNIPLQEFTDFEWDEVCFFKQADSFPTSAYDSYKAHIDTIPDDIEPLRSGSPATIFLFRHGHHYRQLAFRRMFIEIQTVEHFLYLDVPQTPEYRWGYEGCLSQPVVLRKTVRGDTPAILLTRTQEQPQ